jgi:hypothetical protein
MPSVSDTDIFVLHFSDGTSHRLKVPSTMTQPAHVIRQEWLTALKEHKAYSAYYLWGCENSGNSDTESVHEISENAGKPLGSMQEALAAASNQLGLLETQLGECGALVQALEHNVQMGMPLHQSTYLVRKSLSV